MKTDSLLETSKKLLTSDLLIYKNGQYKTIIEAGLLIALAELFLWRKIRLFCILKKF